MDDDSHVIDKGWDALPDYAKSGDTDDAVTVSISTTPGEWLVNTNDSVVVPMSMADVVEALRQHKLNERSLVWRAGMQEWAAIDKVPQLKLAARMPTNHPASSPPASAPAGAPSTPPASIPAAGRPASKSPPPRSAPQQPNALSRRSTLPFGMPSPNATSRPSQPRLSSPVSAPPPATEEPGVLAVYARPAATISFDLSPSEPARVPPAAAPPPPPPPQTLAPTTSDTRRAPRSFPPPSPADLSVVAASQFRAVQRTSKRLLWVSSLASAAAASLLTLWLSGAAPWARLAGTTAPKPQAAAAVAAQLQAPAALAATLAPSAPSEAKALAESPAASAAPAPAAATSAAASPAKPSPLAAAPKPARKPKAVSVAAAAPRAVEATARQPNAEPNPYDVKLDDEAAQPAGKPAAPGLLDMMQASEQKAVEAKQPEASAASGSSSPGF